MRQKTAFLLLALVLVPFASAYHYNPLFAANKERFVTGIVKNITVVRDRASFVLPQQKNIVVVAKSFQKPKMAPQQAYTENTNARDITLVTRRARPATKRVRLTMQRYLVLSRMQTYKP